MGVLPQFSLDCLCEVDLCSMPPAVAEVYVVTMFSALKERGETSRWPCLNPIAFLVPPYRGEDVFCTRGSRPNGKAGSDDEQMEHKDALSGSDNAERAVLSM